MAALAVGHPLAAEPEERLRLRARGNPETRGDVDRERRRLLLDTAAVARGARSVGPLPATAASRARGDRDHPSVASLLDAAHLSGAVALRTPGEATPLRAGPVASRAADGARH